MLTRLQLACVVVGFTVALVTYFITDTAADRALNRRVEALEAEARHRTVAAILGTNSEVSYVLWGTNIVEVSRK